MGNDQIEIPHVSAFWRWLTQPRRDLKGITFLFESQVNATSPRYSPLFLSAHNIEVVLLKGLRVPKTDWILLRLFKILQKCLKRKVLLYEWLHVTDFPRKIAVNQIFHIDDPEYSNAELERIREAARWLRSRKKRLVCICTNSYSKNWLDEITEVETRVLPQGFTRVEVVKGKKQTNFSCVYSSPYIDYKRDRHENHSAWGAILLIDELIPLLLNSDSEIQVHLIGKLGRNAMEKVSSYPNVVVHGLVSRHRNAELLRRMDVGIYPRQYDHKRHVQKIFEYIGAEIPIVTFDLIDTEIVKNDKLGISVKSTEEFVRAIVRLKNDESLYSEILNQIREIKDEYCWEELGKRLDSWQDTGFSN